MIKESFPGGGINENGEMSEALDRPTVVTIIAFGMRLVDHMLGGGREASATAPDTMWRYNYREESWIEYLCSVIL